MSLLFNRHHTFFLILLLFLYTISTQSFNETKKCEKILGSFFTQNEKQLICSSQYNKITSAETQVTTDDNIVGTLFPLCASEIRKEFKLKFDSIISLCRNSYSLRSEKHNCKY